MTDPSPGTVNEEAPPIVGVRRYPRYPDYRESGVGWLGEIPAHWQVKRTRHVARLESGHTPSRNNSEYWQDCNIPWFTLADVWQIREGGKDVVTETKEQISEMGLAHSAARLLPKGTVILSRTASVGFSAIAGVDLATTQDYVNWVCKSELRPEYLLLVFRSMNSEFQRLTIGSTHRTIYMPDVRSFSTPLPTIEEQEKIVSFVQFETEKIDTLVAKKERLIELLQEKRTALITRAVTKGIDLDAKMKDSGIEWLGKIPTHWEVKPVNHLSTILRGRFTHRPRNDPSLYGGPYPFIQTGEVARAKRQISDYRQTLNERGLKVSKLYPSGTLVMTIAANIGDVAILDFPACFPDSIVGFLPGSGVERDFLFYVLLAMKPNLLREAPVNTQGNLNVERIGSRDNPAPVPGRSEQREIALFLDHETAKIDALMATVREAIDRLKELRTALISAVVTGKIDVRETPA